MSKVNKGKTVETKGDGKADAKANTAKGGIQWTRADLAVSSLKAHPLQPKGRTGDGLVESVRQDGVRDPILVSHDGRTILSGHRRADAAAKAGLATIPALIAGEPLGSVKEAAIVARSNIERSDMTAGDNARFAYEMRRLMTKVGHKPTAKDVASGMSATATDDVSESSVTVWLWLADRLNDDAREAFFDGKLSQRQAQALAKAKASGEEKAKAAGMNEGEIRTAGESAQEEAFKPIREGVKERRETPAVTITRDPSEIAETILDVIGGTFKGNYPAKAYTRAAAVCAWLLGADIDYTDEGVTPKAIELALAARYEATKPAAERARAALGITESTVKVARAARALEEAKAADAASEKEDAE